MTSFIFALVFLAIAIGTVVVRKTYDYVPLKELKRRAEKGDETARVLYRAVAYKGSLRVLLWVSISLSSAAGTILLARSASFWLALITVAAVVWAAFSWLPATKLTGAGARLTLFVTPLIAKILSLAYPLLNRTAQRADRHLSSRTHTGLYERTDLVKFIEQQAAQDDSRLSIEELTIVNRALAFDDHTVSDILTSRSKVKTISSEDTVGPILIDELHKLEAPFVLVENADKDAVGVLMTRQLGLHSTGLVRDHMLPNVYYVHESDTLREALHAFFVTNSPVLVVTNSHEEYVGILTIESIIRQLLGHLPGEEFEQYADRRLVAARHSGGTSSAPTEEMVE